MIDRLEDWILTAIPLLGPVIARPYKLYCFGTEEECDDDTPGRRVD